MTDEAVETVTIRPEERGQRLDRVLAARIPSLSRSRLKALILGGQVAIAAHTIRDPATHVNSGDTRHRHAAGARSGQTGGRTDPA